jgi:predicted YcjX-like family ATPase
MTKDPGLGARLWTGVRNATSGAGDRLDNAFNEQRICLAVTGLSRAGKTVFITSLIQNLVALGKGRPTFPLTTNRLKSNGHRRLKKVTLIPTGIQTVPYFDFQSKLKGLSGEDAVWPPPTDEIAQISIALEIEREGIGQIFGTRRVRLDILDYPGEWLLDLPLLGIGHSEWSEDTLERLSVPALLPYTGRFLDYLHGLVPEGPANDATLRQGHKLYKDALIDLRSGLGLRYLQPGRFLCPGPTGDAPFLWFFPMLGTGVPLSSGSLGVLLRDRFETYKREVRSTFFDTHFRTFNRQVMLVDVLGCLYAGKIAFDDTARAIFDLAVALRDGWGFWSKKKLKSAADGVGKNAELAAVQGLQRGGWVAAIPLAAAAYAVSALIRPKPVERVAFVATKADHVPELDRQNLKSLLKWLSKPASEQIDQQKAVVSYHAAAAIRSTEDITFVENGRPVRAVQGVLVGGGPARPFSPGQIPAGEVPAYFWDAAYFELPKFRPPRIDPKGSDGIRHLALDEVLDALIGDLL